MSWTRERVREEVIAILRPHVPGEVALSATSHLVADLGIDSLGVMEVVADLEDKFKLTIPDEALRDVDTVEDVAAAISKRLAEGGRLEG
jgi:acyl carrier protein